MKYLNYFLLIVIIVCFIVFAFFEDKTIRILSSSIALILSFIYLFSKKMNKIP